MSARVRRRARPPPRRSTERGRRARPRRGPGRARRPRSAAAGARRPGGVSTAGASADGASGRTAPPEATAQLDADLGEQVGELDVEGVADGGEQLRRGFLLPALDLGQVAEADPGRAGDVAQRPALTQPVAAQGVAELGAQQRHGRLLSCERGSGGAAGRHRALTVRGAQRPGPTDRHASADGVTLAPTWRSRSAGPRRPALAQLYLPGPGALIRVRLGHPSGTELPPGGAGCTSRPSARPRSSACSAGCHCTCAGRRVPVPPGSRRLLAYLALHPDGVDRRVAAGVLWPDVEDCRAAGNLRSALWRLQQVGCPLVVAEQSWLGLREDVEVDLAGLEAWATRVLADSPAPGDLGVDPGPHRRAGTPARLVRGLGPDRARAAAAAPAARAGGAQPLLPPGGPSGRRRRGGARRGAGRAAARERSAGAHRGPPGGRRLDRCPAPVSTPSAASCAGRSGSSRARN